MLDRFLRHEADVLVGTQMIAKGLDLPLVSVVGVIAADTGLHLPDFRAGERTFQLLTQVAGRAGRQSAGRAGGAPDLRARALRAAGRAGARLPAFYTQEIAFRRQTGYPPFSRLVRFVYTSGSDDRGRRAAEELAAEIRRLAAGLDLGDWGIIGPAPAFFHRQRNRFRWHLLLRAADPAAAAGVAAAAAGLGARCRPGACAVSGTLSRYKSSAMSCEALHQRRNIGAGARRAGKCVEGLEARQGEQQIDRLIDRIRRGSPL